MRTIEDIRGRICCICCTICTASAPVGDAVRGGVFSFAIRFKRSSGGRAAHSEGGLPQRGRSVGSSRRGAGELQL
jgi:hypothetical protein